MYSIHTIGYVYIELKNNLNEHIDLLLLLLLLHNSFSMQHNGTYGTLFLVNVYICILNDVCTLKHGLNKVQIESTYFNGH